MGVHWYQYNYDVNQSCDKSMLCSNKSEFCIFLATWNSEIKYRLTFKIGIPFFLIYDDKGDQSLVAFAWHHIAGIKGDR